MALAVPVEFRCLLMSSHVFMSTFTHALSPVRHAHSGPAAKMCPIFSTRCGQSIGTRSRSCTDLSFFFFFPPCESRGLRQQFVVHSDEVAPLHSIHSQHVVPCVTMPLNTAQYLTKHGWEGHGKPLDGERGRGLKKPLMIPKKRNLGGIGQDRDRAVEWWDDVFAVRTICSL